MTDRELLELAAKAAGIEIDPIDAIHEPEEWDAWNALYNDGDALRLAVKLRLLVDVKRGDTYCIGPMDWGDGEPHNGDPYAATRRAIVRAAAEIGRAMP